MKHSLYKRIIQSSNTLMLNPLFYIGSPKYIIAFQYKLLVAFKYNK